MRSYGSKNNFLMKEFYKNPFPSNFIRNLRMFNKNETADEKAICKRNSQYRAKITFRLATDFETTTVKTRRLSFFDMLSGFGNTIYFAFLVWTSLWESKPY